MYKIYLSCMFLILLGCTVKEDIDFSKMKSEKVSIIFYKTDLHRGWYNYYYYVNNNPDYFVASGQKACVDIFPIEIGKKYETEISYYNGKVYPIRDLCMFNTKLKNR